MLNIIVVQESDNVRSLAGFINTNFRLKVKMSGVSSQQALIEKVSEEEAFDLLIVDADSETFSPIDVANTFLDFNDNCHIFFFGESINLDKRVRTHSSLEEFIDIAYFFEKPFDQQTFETVFMDLLIKFQRQQEEKATVEGSADDYAPVKLRNFYLFNEIKADAYIKVSQNKFMKVIDANTPFPQALIQSYARRKVKQFYLEKSQQIKMLEEAVVEIFINLDKYKDIPTILENQVRAITVIQSYLKSAGPSESIFELTDKVIERISTTFEKMNFSLKAFFKEFKVEMSDISEKSILTAYLCMGILNQLSYTSQSSAVKFSLASILCDCTLDNEDLAKISLITDPNLKMFSEEEQEDFKNHPLRAGEVATLFTKYPEVDFIIEQHHELPNGKGFPRGLNAKKITQASAIFIIANDMATHIIQRGLSSDTLRFAFKAQEERYNHQLFKEIYRALVKSCLS